MKVVIEIPDDTFEALRKYVIISGQRSGKTLMSVLFNAVRNGTPLPKGHGRLIDADKLKEVYETTEDAEYCKWTLYGVTSEIDDAETIIEADTESEVEE